MPKISNQTASSSARNSGGQSRKNLVLICVASVLFVVSGIVLYRGMFTKPDPDSYVPPQELVEYQADSSEDAEPDISVEELATPETARSRGGFMTPVELDPK